jgi:hypothetical protein
LEGLEAELTMERITMIIFNSCPEPWKQDFKSGTGNPENATWVTISMECMNLREMHKRLMADEVKHKKRRKNKIMNK